MKTIQGVSIILDKHKKYVGPWVRGRWADDNPINSIPLEERKGWNLKFDITFGYTIRPIGKLYHWRYWFKKSKEDFNATLNPWMSGNHWFIARIPKWVPTFFIGLGTPIKNIYFGFKSYRLNPYEIPADAAWVSEKELEIYKKSEEKEPRFLCPSFSIRSERG